jgi:hypothetical protein
MNVWKVVGLAGLAGVASAGVIIAREQRQRTQLAPDDIRARLHERLEQAPATASVGAGSDVPAGTTTRRRWRPQRPHSPAFRRRVGLARRALAGRGIEGS